MMIIMTRPHSQATDRGDKITENTEDQITGIRVYTNAGFRESETSMPHESINQYVQINNEQKISSFTRFLLIFKFFFWLYIDYNQFSLDESGIGIKA